jgi:hypothetical protein
MLLSPQFKVLSLRSEGEGKVKEDHGRMNIMHNGPFLKLVFYTRYY